MQDQEQAPKASRHPFYWPLAIATGTLYGGLGLVLLVSYAKTVI